MKKAAGYMTVYLSLTLGVLVTLSLALIEGVRINTMQLEAMCAADAGMDSVMAEYHRELFRRFNILAIDSSYGGRSIGREKVRGRLNYYLSQNLSVPYEQGEGNWREYFYRDFLQMQLTDSEVEGVLALTDGGGECFRQEAVKALQDDLGITAAQELIGWLQTVGEYELDTRDVEEEKRKADEKIAAYRGKEIQIQENETEILEYDDPTIMVEERKKTGILYLTMGDRELSGRRLNQDLLIGRRMKDGRALQGNLPVQKPDGGEAFLEKIAFAEYLMRYMGNFLDEQKEGALAYETEYILAGMDADADNLKKVLHKLLAMREAANAVYLYSDKKKYEEADLAALAVSAVLLMPELQEPVRTAILLAWAYAESVYDLKVLLAGGGVPLIKDEKTWHYGLSGILADVWDEVWHGDQATRNQEGLRYQDYLRVLLLLMNEEDMIVRAMNMVEADIRQTPGNQAFRLDGCFVQIKSRVRVESGFGYPLEWLEEKRY